MFENSLFEMSFMILLFSTTTNSMIQCNVVFFVVVDEKIEINRSLVQRFGELQLIPLQRFIQLNKSSQTQSASGPVQYCEYFY